MSNLRDIQELIASLAAAGLDPATIMRIVRQTINDGEPEAEPAMTPDELAEMPEAAPASEGQDVLPDANQDGIPDAFGKSVLLADGRYFKFERRFTKGQRS